MPPEVPVQGTSDFRTPIASSWEGRCREWANRARCREIYEGQCENTAAVTPKSPLYHLCLRNMGE